MWGQVSLAVIRTGKSDVFHALCRFSVAIMMDTEGSEIHTQELEQPIKADVRI